VTAALSRTRPIPRRGLSHDEACQYVGVSATVFDRMVSDGRMPGAKRADGRVIWDIYALDIAFDALPDNNAATCTGWEDADADEAQGRHKLRVGR
jgi:excisionase family DNA binding protein